MTTLPSIPGFHGRDAELAWLRNLFEQVAETRVPRLAVVVAESGIGKSRLVQALYQQLTVDPVWDPADHDYWPDAFQGDGDSLRVNPELSNHVPKGPPMFMWLGMRWHPTDERNLNERICPLPEARDALQRHHELARQQLPFWKELLARGGDSVGDLTIETLTDAGADAIGIPGFNILKAGFKTVTETLSDRSKGLGHHNAVQQGHQDAGEAFIELLSKLCGGSNPLPTVLWLDDAQWIDAVTLQMLGPLFEQARRRRWPLLVVATHWEREWREGLRERQDLIRTSLADFASHDFAPPDEDKSDGGSETTTQARVLEHGANLALRAALHDRLPGLTDDQQALLVEKAAGNFLTMVENIGELRKSSKLFLDRDFARPLSEKGLDRVRHWESDRERRVKQRFDDLEEDVRDLLGWGSHIGQRFIGEVVARFAESRKTDNARGHLSDCVDPGAILAEPNPHLREFRDRAFHRVASSYFDDLLRDDDEDDLTAILRDHLTTWVNACFDDDGDLLPSPNDPDLEPDTPTAPEASIMALEVAERLDFLLMAATQLPIPETPDWDDPSHQAALRARCFLVGRLANDGLWDRVREEGRPLADVPWLEVPNAVVAIGYRWQRAGLLKTAGAHAAAKTILESVLADFESFLADECRQAADAPSTNLDNLIVLALTSLGDLLRIEGDLDAAHQKFLEGLEIARRLAEELRTPTSLGDVGVIVERLGDIDQARGDFDAAHQKFLEGLEIARRVAEELGTPKSLRNVSVSLTKLGDIDRARSDLYAAQAKFQECLENSRRLAQELGTPESLQDVSGYLIRLGDIDRARGDLDAAQAKFREGLEINRRLAEELGTPQSRRDVLVALGSLGKTDQKRGDLDSAQRYFEQDLEIARRLADELGTPNSLRDVHMALFFLAQVDLIRQKPLEAEPKAKEALQIALANTTASPTPGSRRDVSTSLNLLGLISQTLGDLATARSRFEDSLNVLDQLAKDLGTKSSQIDYGKALFRLGDCTFRLGDQVAAKRHFVSFLSIARALRGELQGSEGQDLVSISLSRLSTIDEQLGNSEQAAEWRAELTKLKGSDTNKVRKSWKRRRR